jgi:hypothetical protein
MSSESDKNGLSMDVLEVCSLLDNMNLHNIILHNKDFPKIVTSSLIKKLLNVKVFFVLDCKRLLHPVNKKTIFNCGSAYYEIFKCAVKNNRHTKCDKCYPNVRFEIFICSFKLFLFTGCLIKNGPCCNFVIDIIGIFVKTLLVNAVQKKKPSNTLWKNVPLLNSSKVSPNYIYLPKTP